MKDSPESQYAFDMMRAKLRGYIQRPEVTLRQYPVADSSKPARYARAMAYFREPDMAMALGEIEGLLKDEPNNPYFLEMYGQIKVEMGKVEEGIGPYKRSVEILPDAPLIRVALAAAMLGTENPKYTADAAQELQTALVQEYDNVLAWYELAQAYGAPGSDRQSTACNRGTIFRGGCLPAGDGIRRAGTKAIAAGVDRVATRNRHSRHLTDASPSAKKESLA